MANRYWVGGTASWDGTAGTKWALTSGGTGGEAVPTSADDVFFDANSGANTVTIAVGNTGAKSINCTGFTGTLTGSAAISVAGSVTLVTGMTYSHSGTMTFTGTGTLITANKTFSGVEVNGSGITLTLGDALYTGTSRDITVTAGTLSTANYSLSGRSLISSNSNTRTINLGSSNVTLSSTTPVNFATSTNLTFNAGTSSIQSSGAGTNFSGGGLTYYNVSYISTSAGIYFLNDVNTFNNLTFAAYSSVGYKKLIVNDNQTINGTFTCSGSSATNRNFIIGYNFTAKTLTVGTLTANDCDFQDITIAGTAAGTAPTRAGDCGGNSGITFPASKTVYRVGTNTSWAGSSSWATSTGGTGSDTNFPLPQDVAVINNDTALSGTLSLPGSGPHNGSSLDASNRTNAITFSFTSGATFFGYLKLGSGVTLTGTGSLTFEGRTTYDLVSAGKTFTNAIILNAPNLGIRLGDALTNSDVLQVNYGTFDANNFNCTISRLSSSNSNVRTITMGSGLWTLSGISSVWDFSIATNLTLNKNTANILLSNTGSSLNRTIVMGGKSLNKVTIGGSTGASTSLTITTGVAATIDELASIKTVAHTIAFSNNNVTFNTWSVTGSAGNVVTVNSSTAGTRRTLGLTNATTGIDYLSVKDIGISTANKFYVGANSTDGGNNSNVYFTAPPTGAGNMLMLF